ncbi:P-loop containing nucleoside triphosphate hydrolase protein [Lactarius quietus]|nr:P-loop containing nucleoside triphosphate hydrolase protein [Lactarius quietus]
MAEALKRSAFYAIPLALDNHDVLARARTGSGKTAAYCVPLVQKILNAKTSAADEDVSRRQCTRALILVPIRELAEQVHGHLRGLIKYCEGNVPLVNVAGGVTSQLQRQTTSLGYPLKFSRCFRQRPLSLSHLESLVIDEADLILPYGHDEDICSIYAGNSLPTIYQSFLMSATMTDDVESLKALALRSPVTLKLEDDEDGGTNLMQYVPDCRTRRTTEVDNFLLHTASSNSNLFRENVLSLALPAAIFYKELRIKRGVTFKLEVHANRFHAVQEFNKGVYDPIIAADESGGEQDNKDSEDSDVDEQPDDEQFTATQREADEEAHDRGPRKRKRKHKRETTSSTKPKPGPRKKGRGAKRDAEHGVARGVDFLSVARVLNFDLPTSARAYTHHRNRAVLCSMRKAVGTVPSTQHNEQVWGRIARAQQGRVEAFRYRMKDALHAVTRYAIREARLKEIKQELLTSEKLKAHFEDHPNDLEYLKLTSRCIRRGCNRT